jgi:hypothetical protein
MRPAGLLLALAVLFALAACDDDPKPAPGAAPSGSASPPASAASPPTPSATVQASAAATAAPGPPMPPRPFPIGSSGPVQPSSPPELQMMTIAYTLAMVAPRSTDPLVDKAYIEEMLKKLEVAARSADKGKTPANPVKSAKGGRKIEVEMGKGCTDRIPKNLIAQRAGSSLKAAFDAGVLAISCHDDKWECHQATRDPADVLCHAAPRR